MVELCELCRTLAEAEEAYDRLERSPGCRPLPAATTPEGWWLVRAYAGEEAGHV
jgi:hypothetical protein